jgi:hypothetical protein
VTGDELFLHTLEDLEERAGLGKGEYDALMMALLLRKLLLDDVPLVHAANRHRRLRIQFKLTELTPPLGVENWALNEAFHPSGADSGQATVELNLDQLLKRTVLVAFGEHISVRELIKFLAQHYGAVHASPADDEKTRALRDEAWGARITTPKGQYSGPVHALAAVAHVVLDGLSPLREQVTAQTRGWRRGLGRHDDPEKRDL